MAREQLVTTTDGRTLQVVMDGDVDARLAIFALHGTPGTAALYQPHVDDARHRGIRLIGYDRPGYADSTPQPGRRVADAAADVTAIAEALGLEAVAVWGHSGGGPHALACAALAEPVVAAAALASPAPKDAEGLDWTAGMGELNLREFDAAAAGRAALVPFLEEEAAGLRAADAAGMAEAWRSLLAPVDAAVVTGEIAEFLVASIQGALARGVDGWVDDDLAFVEPWGFDLAAIETPVLLWHGAHDLFVPAAHAQWLAARIPTAEARVADDDGHITLVVERIPAVHEWLVERLQRSAAGPERSAP